LKGLRKDEVVLRVRRKKIVLLECNPAPKQWEMGDVVNLIHICVEFLFTPRLQKKKRGGLYVCAYENGNEKKASCWFFSYYEKVGAEMDSGFAGRGP